MENFVLQKKLILLVSLPKSISIFIPSEIKYRFYSPRRQILPSILSDDVYGLSSAAIPSTLSKNKYYVLKLSIDSIPPEVNSYWLYPLQVFCPFRRWVLLLSPPKLWVVSLPWILLLLSTLKTSITSILFECMLLLFLPWLYITSIILESTQEAMPSENKCIFYLFRKLALILSQRKPTIATLIYGGVLLLSFPKLIVDSISEDNYLCSFYSLRNYVWFLHFPKQCNSSICTKTK